MADDEIEKRKRVGSNTSSCDPKLMNARVFMGNFPADIMSRQEVEQLFKEFGKILGISLHKTYGFVQYAREEDAKTAVEAWNGKKLKGQILGESFVTCSHCFECGRNLKIIIIMQYIKTVQALVVYTTAE